MTTREELDSIADPYGFADCCAGAYERGDLIPADEVTAEAVRIHNSRIPIEDIRELWEAAEQSLHIYPRAKDNTFVARLKAAVEALRERMER